ncbi:MAG: outer membrane beta-barrel protein [Alphaproteobacteria bacterium]|nr:outer membrane beta-barrel protein [Alphaproteobacteria bacterium]
MTFQKTLLTAAAATTLFTAAAGAADDDRKFDGVYGGVEAGVDWTKLAGDVKRDRSVYYGGVLGFRTQMDNDMVIGLEGTFGDSGYNNHATGFKSEYEWSAGLTLGQAFGDDGANLIYGKAAYVKTRFKPTGETGEAFSDAGWRFGGGYERALSENLSFRLGGDYTTYGKDKNGWSAKAGLLARF